VLPVGVNYWSARLAIDGLRAPEIIEALAAVGQDGFQFDAVTRMSPTLDAGELAEVRAMAAARSFYLEGGLPSIDPLTPDPDLLAAGDGDLRLGVERHLRAIRSVVTGSAAVRTFIALPWDRGNAGADWATSWPRTLDAVRELLVGIVPVLRELDLRLAVENHGDGTIAQLVELVESVDPEVCGLCLDTANLALTLEDPLAGTRAAAPHVFAAHVKDAIVARADDGRLVVHGRTAGEGVFPLPEMLAVLSAEADVSVLTIEDHDGLFAVPADDPAFVAGLHADGSIDEGSFAALVRESERRIAAGEAPGIAALESIPWEQQWSGRLERTAAYVRRTVREQTEPMNDGGKSAGAR
jgi:sugar phosphate isomerase/epimerase